MGRLAEAEAAADELVDFVPSLGSLSLRGVTRRAQGDREGLLRCEPFLGDLYADRGDTQQAEQRVLKHICAISWEAVH